MLKLMVISLHSKVRCCLIVVFSSLSHLHVVLRLNPSYAAYHSHTLYDEDVGVVLFFSITRMFFSIVPARRPVNIPQQIAATSNVLPNGDEIYAEVKKDKKGSSSTTTPSSPEPPQIDEEEPPKVPERTEERHEPHPYMNLSSMTPSGSSAEHKPELVHIQYSSDPNQPIRDSVFSHEEATEKQSNSSSDDDKVSRNTMH